jgi:hypothetical protein
LAADVAVPSVRLKSLPEAKVRSAGMSAHFVGAFPIDTKLPSPKQSFSLDLKLELDVASPEGTAAVDMTMRSEHSQSREL